MPHRKTDLKSLVFEQGVYCNDTDLSEEIEDLLARLKIDPNALDEEASEHSSLFARWALLAEEAAAHERWLKRDLEITQAEAERWIRKQFAEEGKKTTESRIASEIKLDKEVRELSERWLDAQRDSGILGAIRQALVHRREMIAELLRDRRHEWSASERSV
jgi:hypothetical protein